MSTLHFQTELNHGSEKAQWKHFCKQHKQKLPENNCRVFYASLCNDDQSTKSPIGLVKLYPTQTPDTLWLRALFVCPNHRRKGYAHAIMQQCHQYFASQNTRIVIFALNPLQGFYESLGYQCCSAQTLPQDLQNLWSKAETQNQNWMLMHWLSNHSI